MTERLHDGTDLESLLTRIRIPHSAFRNPQLTDLPLWIRLTKTGASARRLNRLLDSFDTPDRLFGSSAIELARLGGCSMKVAERLLDPAYAATQRDLDLMDRLGVTLIVRHAPEYPRLLREIPDPPVALYVRGTLTPGDSRAVGIVGSRQATDYGKRLADRFSAELVEAGFTIVSGLAKGLDTAAHGGALRAGGRTLACLGCGVDVAYPYENRALAASIAQSGALVSEYPMMCPPDAWHFPSRNRVISGLSVGIVVIEAPIGSGALITAEAALEQGREVLAVPGNVENFRNRGPHALLKDGAKLVETVEDILQELCLPIQGSLGLDVPEPPPFPTLTPEETALYQLLDAESRPVDDLILESGMPASQVNSSLLLLEMKGVARRLPGNAFVRVR